MNKTEKHMTPGIHNCRITKEDIRCMLLLAAGTLVFAILLTLGGRIYGSEVDWISQHSVLPEYFRQQFYETGNLLPEFAAHLGGGQNIFHFSYYGLLSPVILPSYLLPGVPMTTYLSVVSVLLLMASGTLCYLWLKNHSLSTPATAAAAFLFQFSAAMLYHSHKQVMFVSYMPFLLLAFMGVDSFFRRKKSGLMMTGIFLMTMTSYFYSIGGLLALTVYGIYIYFSTTSKAELKEFVLTGLNFALRIIIPVGMAALLLLPSLAAIFNGRSGEASPLSLSSLLIPHVDLLNLLYSPYGIGLTARGLLAALRLLLRRRPGERILFTLLAILFSVPFFLYLLNGGLYLRGKVFIPFLPVMILITASYLEEILTWCREGNTSFLKQEFLKATAFCLILLALDHSIVWLGFAAECALVLTGFYHGIKKRSFLLCCLPSFIVCLGVCVGVNVSDPLVSDSQAQDLYSADKQDLLEQLGRDGGFAFRMNDFTQTEFSANLVASPNCYRTSLYSSTYDDGYNRFHSDGIGNVDGANNGIACYDTPNLLFQTFMGVRYIIAEGNVPAGYELAAQKGEYKLYENPDVFPLAWGSSSLMSQKEFDSLPQQDKNAALLNYIIVEEAPESGYQSPLRKETLNLGFPETADGSHIHISLKEDTSILAKAPAPLNERLYMLSLSFDREPEQDIVIEANGAANLLTGHKDFYPNHHYNFQYMLSGNTPNDSLDLRFSAGDYTCTKPQLYSMDVNEVRRAAQSVTPLMDSGLKTDKTVLKGTISMEKDGYFTASIPYDSGFTALVDGRPQPIEQVNNAFLGFPLAAGSHEIKLIYRSPMLATGKSISSVFFLLFLAVLILEQAQQQSSYSPVRGRRKQPASRPVPVFTINASCIDI